MEFWVDPNGEPQVRIDPIEAEELSGHLRGCPDVVAIHDYLESSDEVIGAEDLRWVEEHIKTCPTCREEVARAREFNAYLGTPAGQRYLDEIGKRVEKKQGEAALGELRMCDEVRGLLSVGDYLFRVKDATPRQFGSMVEQARGGGQFTVVMPSGEEVSENLSALQVPSEGMHYRLAASSGNQLTQQDATDLRTLYASSKVEVLYDTQDSVFLRLKERDE